jgi:hypothetical protein
VVIWPESSQHVPDSEPHFIVAYLPLEFAGLKRGDQEQKAIDMLINSGKNPRRYRNGLGLAIPNREQIDALKYSTRYIMAIQRVYEKKKQLRITKEQEDELKERLRTENSGLESALRTLYDSVWLLSSNTDSKIEPVEAVGRPLQANTVHERLLELLTSVSHKVHVVLAAKKISELFFVGVNGSGASGPKILGVSTRDIVDTFFGSPGFPRLINSDVIVKSIVSGVASTVPYFAYWPHGKPPFENGQYRITKEQLVVGRALSEDEVDLEGAFIIHPDAIPQAEVRPTLHPGGESLFGGTSGTSVLPSPEPARVTDSSSTELHYLIEANRDQLYESWKPIANLADLVGKVVLRIDVKTEKKIDKDKLRNSVEEPLDELGVLKNEGS